MNSFRIAARRLGGNHRASISSSASSTLIGGSTRTDASTARTLTTTTSDASDFTPPQLNKYHGTPVYENVDIATPPTPDSSAFQRNADPDAVHVVTGASRGMGLQYVQSLLDRTKGKVVAACRTPDNASQLHNFLSTLPPNASNRVKVLELDVTNQIQIDNVATEIAQEYDRVDTLFNVAGVLGNPTEDPGPERNLAMLDASWLEQQFKVNAIGPMMLTRSLAPLMRSKKGRKSSRPETVVVNMSARVASIADNTGPLGWHSYRMSKAALNMGTRTICHELRRQGTWAIVLYPGMTDTDMSKPFQKGMKPEMIFPVSFTVKRMLDVVDGMEEKHSGGLYDWAGQALPF